VIGPDWEAVINLSDLELREAIGCDERVARRALGLVGDHRELLLTAWRRIHG